MSTSSKKADERVKDVKIKENFLTVFLMDGRIISVPLSWYPKLIGATKTQLKAWEICAAGYGIHWEELDEDLSTEGMLRGAPSPKSIDLSA